MIDPQNPVVKLCAAGMQAEAEGQFDKAYDLFEQAWMTSQDDYERCVAAHFVARQQDDPQQMLHWNLEALAQAESVADERVQSFYPSLYLNLGFSYETLGNRVEARRHYEQAAQRLDVLPSDPYGDTVRDGVTRGLARTASVE
ncbi:MAG: hypothetical protein KDJ65_38285 [Anaerolineae bacterium]|nr:hypothetical protein [Anaerolineae bacterium]